MKSKGLRTFLVIMVIGILLCVGIPKLLPELFWRMKINDVESHAALWSKQGIAKYKLKVHVTSRLLSYPGATVMECYQELVVRHNAVVSTLDNLCNRAEYQKSFFTVDNLFTIIADEVKSRSCDPEGCECGPMVVDVAYDPKYFYPKTIKTTYEFKSAWIFGWQVFCMGMGWNNTKGIGLETSSFIPIQ